MVDPSIGATMDGRADRVCVRDHAGDAAFRIAKGYRSERSRHQTRWIAPPARECNADIPAILRFWLSYRQLGRATTFPSKFERKSMLRKFLRDESAATAIEYSLIAGFIALAIIAAVGMTGQRLVALFESLIPALTLP
jgi:pilus assembly protein Flp/PilA